MAGYCAVHSRRLPVSVRTICAGNGTCVWLACPLLSEPAGYNDTGRQRTPPSTFPRYAVSRRPASKLVSRLFVACLAVMRRGASSHDGLVGRALAREWEAHSPQHDGPYTQLSQYWSIVLSRLVVPCLVFVSFLDSASLHPPHHLLLI